MYIAVTSLNTVDYSPVFAVLVSTIRLLNIIISTSDRPPCQLVTSLFLPLLFLCLFFHLLLLFFLLPLVVLLPLFLLLLILLPLILLFLCLLLLFLLLPISPLLVLPLLLPSCSSPPSSTGYLQFFQSGSPPTSYINSQSLTQYIHVHTYIHTYIHVHINSMSLYTYMLCGWYVCVCF